MNMNKHELLPVPTMRSLLQNVENPPRFQSLPIVVTVFWFVFGSILALGIGFFLSKILFFLAIVFNVLISIVLFYIVKRLLRHRESLYATSHQQLLLAYQPIFAKLNSVGFEAAVDDARLILRHSMDIYHTHRDFFSVVDETLCFVLSKLLAIANGIQLIGDKRELKRRLERLEINLKHYRQQQQQGMVSPVEEDTLRHQMHDVQVRLDRLEDLQRAALEITKMISRLRQECETSLVQRISAPEVLEKEKKYLENRIDLEKRVEEELKKIGL